MSVRKPAKPVAVQRLRQSQLGSDPGRSHSEVSAAVSNLEQQVSSLQDLTREPPTVTGSVGGNTALASLLAALVSLGLVKDGTT